MKNKRTKQRQPRHPDESDISPSISSEADAHSHTSEHEDDYKDQNNENNYHHQQHKKEEQQHKKEEQQPLFPSSPSPSTAASAPSSSGHRPRSNSNFLLRFFSSGPKHTLGATSEELDGTTAAKPDRSVLSWYGIAVICLLLSLLSLALHLFVGLGGELISPDWTPILSVIAVLAATISVPLTHGLAGVKKYPEFHFFQPFIGGYRYVLLQSLGWSLYTLVLLGAFYILVIGAKRALFAVVASVGIGGVIAQVCVLASLHFYAQASDNAYTYKTQKDSKSLIHPTTRQKAMNAQVDEPQVFAALSTASGKAGMGVTILGIILAVILESAQQPLPQHLSLQSLLMSALLLGVPLTHVLTGRRIHPAYSLFMPMQGGWAFVLLQALGWTLWVFAVLFSITSIYLSAHNIHLTGIIGGAGLGAVLSQAMVLLSLQYFDSHLTYSVKAAGRTMTAARKIQAAHKKEEEQEAAAEKIPAAAKEAVDISRLVRLISLDKKDLTPHLEMKDHQLLTAFHEARTNGDTAAIGQLKDRLAKARRFTSSTWRLSHYAQEELIKRGIETKEEQQDQQLQHKLEVSSLVSLSFSQWKDGLSLWLAQMRLYNFSDICLDVQATIVVSGMYFIPIFGASLSFTPFIMVYFFHHIWWVAALCAILVAAYVSTLRGRPSFTGAKSWDFIRRNTVLWSSFERYFQATVIAVGKIDVSKAPVIVAFHPHGIYPLTTFWATRGPSFRAAYPDFEIDVCGASVMFAAPLLREILLWSGAREVSAASIRHALHEKRSILIIPGGQREMLHCSADVDELVYVTKHKGFIRMAIQTGTRLVPILSLGETFALENIRFPRLQRWMLHHTGVGWPVLPYGRWYSPIANPCPITLVVGHPIEVAQIDEPTEAEVDAVHQVYYAAVHRLFEDYKAEAGFPNQVLRFENH